ncbi:hypothetical protein EZ456_05895 [Pedobacter psychrodurus]|uniref:SnoaL-like domain-containing protein n=1 Tax=Pedobacter psychrodurus TaxID=2530456 RepID=A0A4R0PYM1_9SPHI|nr:hypothetical protein [Pedobacter psychrodurus]TCD28220.1 hypothetical protein EZ456_05895 [Pedobacter psychrodurus]
MKKLSCLIMATLLFAACENKEAKTTDTATADSTKYPYTIKQVQNWEMNPDTKNAITAMTLIKTFENLDTASMSKVLADSVALDVDGYKFKGTKPQFLEEIQGEFDKMKGFKIEMHDMESVVNKDKSEEWVSLWYSQVSTTKEGKTDTVALFNDIQLKNGKVVRLSEYVQHPMKK